jgi:hypothetical protein
VVAFKLHFHSSNLEKSRINIPLLFSKIKAGFQAKTCDFFIKRKQWQHQSHPKINQKANL